MLIPKHYFQCVTFLGNETLDVFTPLGTSFLVGIASKDGRSGRGFAVTARHVIESARATEKPLLMKVNKVNGPPEVFECPPNEWWPHPDHDIALHLGPANDKNYEISYFLEHEFADDSFLEANKVGPGDEVFFVGLFSSFSGDDRVEPLARFGNVSMMPRREIPVRNADGSQTKTKGYLVEARSWGGQSGSPAFLHLPGDRLPGFQNFPAESIEEEVNSAHLPSLLGMVIGHFNLEDDEVFATDVAATGYTPVNSGVAVVLPSQLIADALADEGFESWASDQILRS